jgi:hypothetical protein
MLSREGDRSPLEDPFGNRRKHMQVLGIALGITILIALFFVIASVRVGFQYWSNPEQWKARPDYSDNFFEMVIEKRFERYLAKRQPGRPTQP